MRVGHLRRRRGRGRRWPPRRARAPPTARRRAGRRCPPWPSDGGETQTGYGVDVGREPDDLDLERGRRRRRRPGHPAARRPQARRSGAASSCSSRRMAATLLGIVGGTLTGDAVLKGRSPFADRLGERGRRPRCSRWSTTRPTPASSRRRQPRRRGPGLPAQRAASTAACCSASSTTATPAAAAGTASTGSAVRGSPPRRASACQALAIAPGAQTLGEELLAGVGDGLLVQSVTGLHSGVNPVSGDFSVGAEGLMIRRRRAGRAGPGGHHRLDAPALLLDVVRRRLATSSGCPSGAGCAAVLIGEVAVSGA